MPEQRNNLEKVAIFTASCALGSVGALGAMTGSVILLLASALALLVWLLLILPRQLRADASHRVERAADVRRVESNRGSLSETRSGSPPER